MAQTKQDTIRIVLLGKTGEGKSSTGNTILGRKEFGVKFSSVSHTKKCKAQKATVDGQKITVIDTPGLYDTSMTIEELKCKIEELFNNSSDGLHAILLVIKLGPRFTDEEIKAVQWIKTNFGEKASKITIVLFTNGDELEDSGVTIEDYISEGGKLQELVKGCKGRYHVFNNRSNDRSQVTELLEKIKRMTQKNNLYTKEKYEETQRKLSNANTVGAALGAALGAGAGVLAATLAGAAKTVVIASAVGGTVGGAAVAGAVGAGAAIYKYSTRESNENKNKED